MNNSKKKGFTIIELLAAIVIVGILASVATLVINRYILQGHDTVDNQHLCCISKGFTSHTHRM